MAYLNKAFLIGNVGKAPDTRSLQGGAKVSQFTLATTERFTDRGGESHENTEWHTVVVWNKSAEFVERFVKKGAQVFVEGKIRTREWSDQQGNKRYSTEIVADKIQLLDKKEEGAKPRQFDDDDFPL